MKKQAVSFLCFCLLSTQLLPAWNTGSRIQRSGVSPSSSSLIQFCSHFAFPFQAIGDHLIDDTPLSPGIHASSKTGERNSSSDYCLGTGMRTSAVRSCADGGSLAGAHIPVAVPSAPKCRDLDRLRYPPGGTPVFPSLLLYLVVLSRSNLPGEAFVMSTVG